MEDFDILPPQNFLWKIPLYIYYGQIGENYKYATKDEYYR